MNLVQAFFLFVLRPRRLKVTRKHSLRQVVDLHIFILFLFFVNVLLLALVGSLVDLEQFPNRLEEEGIFSNPIYLTLVAVIAAPIIEELLFRFPLRFPLMAIATYPVYLALVIAAFFLSYPSEDLWRLGVPLMIVTILLVLVLPIRSKRKSRWIYRKLFRWVFYYQALVFGLIHIFNYQIDQVAMQSLLPILVVPQIFIGLALGFVRTKYGILMSIYSHALYNGILVSLAQLQGG